jgi:hypothetical protein
VALDNTLMQSTVLSQQKNQRRSVRARGPAPRPTLPRRTRDAMSRCRTESIGVHHRRPSTILCSTES